MNYKEMRDLISKKPTIDYAFKRRRGFNNNKKGLRTDYKVLPRYTTEDININLTLGAPKIDKSVFLGNYEPSPGVGRKHIERNPLIPTNESTKKFLTDFLNDAHVSLKNPEAISIREVIDKYIIDLSELLANYYNESYSEMVSDLNIIMKIFKNKYFANALYETIQENGETAKELLGSNDFIRMISNFLKVFGDEIDDDVLTIYAIDILSDNKFLGYSIQNLVEKGFSTELITMLVISMSFDTDKLSVVEIEKFHQEFINTIMLYVDTDAERLDCDGITLLFNHLVGDPSENDKALKFLGRCLVDSLVVYQENNSYKIYSEYIISLYKMLESCKDNDIAYVLKYINTTIEKNCSGDISSVKNKPMMVLNRDILSNNFPKLFDIMKRVDNLQFLKQYLQA